MVAAAVEEVEAPDSDLLIAAYRHLAAFQCLGGASLRLGGASLRLGGAFLEYMLLQEQRSAVFLLALAERKIAGEDRRVWSLLLREKEGGTIKVSINSTSWFVNSRSS